jgi:hypothetical protein
LGCCHTESGESRFVTFRSFLLTALRNNEPEPGLNRGCTELAIRHWDKNMDLLLATVEDEDFPVGVDIQRGFQANAQSYVTFGRNEPGLSHYHGTMRSLLGLQQAEPATTSA